jgi:hypothetical protein
VTFEYENPDGRKRRLRLTYTECIGVARAFAEMGMSCRAWDKTNRIWFDRSGDIDEVQEFDRTVHEWRTIFKEGGAA